MRRALRTVRHAAWFAAVALLAAATCLAAPLRAEAPTLALSRTTIGYGDGVVLTGVVPSRRAGERISILSQPCRFTEPAEIATVSSGKGGAFRFPIRPLLTTAFRARSGETTSPAVRVKVRPLVSLRRLAAGRYRVDVSTTNPVFLDGHVVLLQRKGRAGWATITRGRLAKASAETAVTVISAATLAVRTTGTLRATLPAAAGSCYVGGSSDPIGA